MSSAPPPGAGASAWGFAKGLGQGAWAGAKSMVTGVRDLAAMSADGWKQLGSLAKDLATDEQARDAAMQAVKDVAKQAGEAGQWIADNPKETIANAKDGLLAAKNKAMEKGKELWESEKAAYRDAKARGEGADFLGEAVGRTAFEVASLFIGVGEASKAGKLAKLTKAEGVMAKAGPEMLPCGRMISEAAAVAKEYSMVDPGPLPERLAGTFSGGRYREIVTTEDVVLKRVGTTERWSGEFFSTEAAASQAQVRMDRAILPKWATGAISPIDTEFDILIPKGTKVYVGQIGTQSGFYVGGTPQIVIPKVWEINGVKVLSQRPIK